MSQVVVEEDDLQEKRAASFQQERKIVVNADFQRFVKKSDVTQRWMIERIIGYALIPILGLWALLVFLGGLVIWGLSSIFRLLGKPFGRG